MLPSILNALVVIVITIYAAILSVKRIRHWLWLILLGALSVLLSVWSAIASRNDTREAALREQQLLKQQSVLLSAEQNLQSRFDSLKGQIQIYIDRPDQQSIQIHTKNAAHSFVNSSSKISIHFKDSRKFTKERKQFITSTLVRFQNYLIGLDIPIPLETAPIGEFEGIGSRIDRAQNISYLGEIMLGSDSLQDEDVIVGAYSTFVTQEIVKRKHAKNNGPYISRAASIIARYYNLSFHDKKPEHAHGKDIWIPVLWHMREKFGREFTDNVMAFALKLVRDDPKEEQDMTFDIYFSRKIKAADAILDNDGQKLQVINEILSGSELKMDANF